ncbi:MAG TPA: molybdopterin-guanine dinucleotide biosynthesis protein B [Bacillaceae bacterium]|nr:molybdopterin-guanine dinucleotide biosynthesis protein B [Bacillaceae bacterium]
MQKLKIFQVVGFSNSGKTTLMEKLIEKGATLGYQVGTIKHHGHGGSPTNIHAKKDSDKHQEAGAHISSVEGDGHLHIHGWKENWNLAEILKVYEIFSLDLVFIEGYKYELFPKVVLIRHHDDLVLLEKLNNIKAVISWIPLQPSAGYDLYMVQDSDLFVEVFYSSMFDNI